MEICELHWFCSYLAVLVQPIFAVGHDAAVCQQANALAIGEHGLEIYMQSKRSY